VKAFLGQQGDSVSSEERLFELSEKSHPFSVVLRSENSEAQESCAFGQMVLLLEKSMGSVRQRSHQFFTDPSCGESKEDGGSSPPHSRKLFVKTNGVHLHARQLSRSPRSSPNQGNPYAPRQRNSFPYFIYIVFCLSLAATSLLLERSISFPLAAENITSTTPTEIANLLRGKVTVKQINHHRSASPPKYARVLYLGGNWDPDYQPRKDLLPADDDEGKIVGTPAVQDDWQPHHEDHCLPKADWQVHSNPNCNSIHEINVATSAAGRRVHNKNSSTAAEESLSVLGEGWFRTTWRLDRPVSDEAVVLKTLRIQREFLSEYYELHRRDAVAMERLTASSFVVNVYGYCGQSAINELANFPFTDVLNLETFNRRMRGKDSARAFAIKLRMAASIALGVADIHAGGTTDPDDENIYITHYDLNPRNIALFAGGRPKINDFNIAEFLRYDPATNETCKFPSRLHEPWWRAPEEMNTTHTVPVDEKVDIYALGNILYHTLTTHSGRGKQKKERMAAIRPLVAAGIRPKIPDVYANSTDPNVIAMVKAIDLCWEKDPADRGTAEEVAAVLYEALLNIRSVPAEVEEKEMNEPPGPDEEEDSQDGDDDSTGESAIEDKDALGHVVA